MGQGQTAECDQRAAVDILARQVDMLQQVQRRERKWLMGWFLVTLLFATLGAAVRIKGADFELWPDAATANPKSSHPLELIGTTGAAVQRSMVLQNKSIDGTSYRLDIRAGATDRLTLKSDGKLGIGTTGPGAKLEVAGQVKITGGVPGATKVLTADAAGLATWETPAATGLSSASNTNTLASDTDANQDDSKLFFAVDGVTRMTINGDSVKNWGDVSTAGFVRLFSVSPEEISPTGMFFKPDGTRMYITGTTGDDINEYSLSTPWDVSSASFTRLKDVSLEEDNPQDVFFKADGTKMYVVGLGSGGVNEYTLSTAWNVTTATFDRVFSVSAEETVPSDIFFKPDGTQMYVLGGVGDDVNEYSLSTAWDVSTATFVRLFSVSGEETNPSGLFFKSDGMRMYVTGNVGDAVNEYTLSTGWDISTAAFVRTFSVSTEETSPGSLFFKPDGTRMYLVGSVGDDVNEYNLTLSTPGFVGIGTTSPQYKLDVRGTIGNEVTEHHGADYAEWFERDVGEALVPGDIIGLNPRSLKVRKYRRGDPFIGVYSTFPGTVGNRDHSRTKAQMRKTHALVGLLGQLPFDRQQTVLDGCTVRTRDGKKIGALLPGGKVLVKRWSRR
ncbi:hypothetical protein JYT15_01105 [Acidimicrobium ferrooxidans]|nr:hypothetical protein [Acidimicrobium ferrooxidans]